MDLLNLMKTRYSVRNYKADEVENEKLLEILEAARVAPTAANKQPQRILVVKSKEGLDKISKATNIFGAPLAFVICGDHDKVWVRPFDKKNMVDIDTSIITDHMMLAAENLGLGSCWITYFKKDIIQAEFNLPPNLEPVSILALGYGSGDAASPDRHNDMRKPLKDTVFYETF